MIIDKHYEICIKAITGNLSKSEKQIFENWLAESDLHVKEFEKLKNIWSNSLSFKVPSEVDIDKEWLILSERINQIERTEESYRRSDKKSFNINSFIPRLRPVLAAIVLIVAAFVVIYYLNYSHKSEVNKIFTLENESKNVLLPDGSTVYLNGNSKIEYSRNFDEKERRVNLQGEAFFAVTKNVSPFIITTDNSKITVLGTKFDVWSRYNKTRIVVDEGVVNFAGGNNSGGIKLTKNQLSIIDKKSGPTEPQSADSKYFLGWMEGKLVFYQTPLDEIVNQLENFYNIKIILERDNLKSFTLTGSFDKSNADTTLSMICLALGLELNKGQNNYSIKTKL